MNSGISWPALSGKQESNKLNVPPGEPVNYNVFNKKG